MATILTIGMNGQQVADAVNNNDAVIKDSINQKASTASLNSHTGNSSIHFPVDDTVENGSSSKLWSSAKVKSKLDSKANSSHPHQYTDIQNADGKFMPKAHTHDLSDINNITGLFSDIRDATVNLTVTNKESCYNSLHFAVEVIPVDSQPIPPFLQIEYEITFGDTSPILTKNGRTQDSEFIIAKPISSWAGWVQNKCRASISLTISNPFSGTSVAYEELITDIYRYNYAEISLSDLVAELKANPSDPNSFIALLSTKIQEDLL